MPTPIFSASKPFRMVQSLALTTALLCGTAQAQNVLHYRCNTVMKYLPTPCPSRGVAPVEDESDIDIDLDKKLWSFGDAGGGIESQGNSITLLQWGARKGRDATIDLATGAFSYQTQDGCLAENETGTCQPRTN